MLSIEPMVENCRATEAESTLTIVTVLGKGSGTVTVSQIGVHLFSQNWLAN